MCLLYTNAEKISISWIKISDPWQSLKTKNRIPAAYAWYNRILFKIIKIFDNCMIVKSNKMDKIIIVERARVVGMLVSRLPLRQLLLTLSPCLSHFQYFIISLEVSCNMDAFSVLSWKRHVTITDNKHTLGVFGILRRPWSCATTKG
jgi:hypothetical protein